MSICKICMGWKLDMESPRGWKRCNSCGHCEDFNKNKVVNMITMQEILKDYKLEDQSAEIQANLVVLLEKANELRQLWGKPMIVTSGLRTKDDQIRVYAAKGITDVSKIPMHSMHLRGAAIDIADPKLELTAWLKAHPEIMDKLNIFCEEGNSNWVHAQVLPFGSYKSGGSRWFKP